MSMSDLLNAIQFEEAMAERADPINTLKAMAVSAGNAAKKKIAEKQNMQAIDRLEADGMQRDKVTTVGPDGSQTTWTRPQTSPLKETLDMLGINAGVRPGGAIPPTGTSASGIIQAMEQGGSAMFSPETDSPMSGFEVEGITIGASGNPSIRIVKRSTSPNLDTEQQIASIALAREIAGVRGMELVLPAIQSRLAEGKSIDDIRDELRYAQQSDDMMGPIRDAIQQLTIGKSAAVSERMMDSLDDLLAKGKTKEAQSYLRRAALNTVGTEEAKQIRAKERTVEFLQEIYDDLTQYEAAGGKTNIFTGTIEQIARKLGTVKSPELRKIATKILAARQKYRRSMTGVAFSPGENKEYDALFPDISKTRNFNTATVNGLLELFAGDIDYFYKSTIGEEAYQSLFGGSKVRDKIAPQSQQPQVDAKGQQFIEGKIYTDGKGNRAKYINGEFVPVR